MDSPPRPTGPAVLEPRSSHPAPKRSIPDRDHPARPHAYNPSAPWNPSQTYVFVGSLTDGRNIGSFSINVLAGDAGPVIKAGWAKVNVIDRAYRLGLTVPYGYDPIQYDIPVQFEAVVPTWRSVPNSLEADIQVLEWMAGRGKLFEHDHGVGRAATGDPPIVTVNAYDSQGNQSNLIEPNLWGVDWIITGLMFGNAAGDVIRHTGSAERGITAGTRIRQKSTVSLTEFVAAPGSNNDSPTTRAKGRNGHTGGFMTLKTDALWNTIQKMVSRYANNHTTAAFADALKFNQQHGLSIRSYRQELRPGTVVRIPYSLTVT